MRKLAIFFIRQRLGLKKYQNFKFENQRSKTDYYYFTEINLMKYEGGVIRPSNVSLNWLLDSNCRIVKEV